MTHGFEGLDTTHNVRVVAVAPNFVLTRLVAPALGIPSLAEMMNAQGHGTGPHPVSAVGDAFVRFIDEPLEFPGGSVATLTNNRGVTQLNKVSRYYRSDDECVALTGYTAEGLKANKSNALAMITSGSVSSWTTLAGFKLVA